MSVDRSTFVFQGEWLLKPITCTGGQVSPVFAFGYTSWALCDMFDIRLCSCILSQLNIKHIPTEPSIYLQNPDDKEDTEWVSMCLFIYHRFVSFSCFTYSNQKCTLYFKLFVVKDTTEIRSHHELKPNWQFQWTQECLVAGLGLSVVLWNRLNADVPVERTN